MNRVLLFLFFVFSGMLPAFAWQRTITLSGTVTDARTAKPLAGASVLIEAARLGAQTDREGRFSFRNVPRGHHLLEVSFTGYGTAVLHLDLEADQAVSITLSSTIVEYQGVTVTGVSNAISTRKTPVPLTVVRRSELLQAPASNIVDVLARQAGVSQVSTGPAISKPVIRGLGFNRVVVVNDGVRQEGQQWGEEHGLEIDEASVNRAEILKGPASLIYGSDALAGVINLVSNVPVQEGIIKGSLLGGYQTNARYYSTNAQVAGNQKGFNWNAYGSLKSAGDYRNRYDGRVFNSRFSEKNYGGYVGLNKGWGFSHVIFSRFHQEPGIVEGDRDAATGRFIQYGESPLEAVVSDADLKGRQAQTPFQQIDHYKVVSDNSFGIGKSRLQVNVAYQNNKRKELGNPEDRKEAELFFDLNTITYNAHYTLPDWNQWKATVGYNGLYQQNTNRGEEAIIPDYHFHDAGAFVYVRGQFSNYTLSGGLRFDNRQIHAREMQEGSELKFAAFNRGFSNLTGSMGISYEPGESVTLKANIGRGFRAPNLAELASNGAHEGTERWEYGAQDLKSEQSLQVDGEVSLNNEHLTGGLNVFYNHVGNFIFYRRLAGADGGDSILLGEHNEELLAYQFAQSDARLYGFELYFDLHPHPLDWLHFENRFSYVRGQFTAMTFGSENLPLMPAPKWLSQLKAKFPEAGKHLSNLYVLLEADNYLRQQHAFRVNNTETPTPAYTLLNAGIGADIKGHNKTLFSLHLSGSNLADKAYQNHLSRLKYTDLNAVTGRPGVFGMGRNFSVKLLIPFSFTTK
ncbi:TonB-dependent receptor [Paraflavisolibacter sp. H34]|uniref:TonB-dependent receptor n=1 Tax=Huijunlia imazamoxiresistens TaxID=3127457 RepID=UPI00301A0E24